MKKTAVVLYNLGGPDSPNAVQPFLFNLFNDPLIIRLPGPLRWLIAKLISSRRAPIAKEIYGNMGGRSPILPETELQAEALRKALGERDDIWIFISMRYWHPFAEETVSQVKSFAPDRVVLLPLYPQYSSTTTQSFIRVWEQAARKQKLDAPVSSLCCYPIEHGFIEALARLTGEGLKKIPDGNPVRILFSAHGLPEKVIAGGDPYRYQIEETVAAVVDRLGIENLDHVVCYQSRVGPMEWIKPYTDKEIERAGTEGKSLVVVPVAFVSEHSETLVELDIEYAELAQEKGVPNYVRVPTVSIAPEYIGGLARLVQNLIEGDTGTFSETGDRFCPGTCTDCPISAS